MKQIFLLCIFFSFFASTTAHAELTVKPEPATLADLVEKLSPAVVNISSTQLPHEALNQAPGQNIKPFPPGHPFEEFNEFFERFGQPQGEMKTTSLGSGFVIDPSGLLVTNNHVIQDADEITVKFSDDSEYDAEIIGRDPKTDLAVVKITNPAKRVFPYISFGDSDKARVGDSVIAIGNPFGLGGTVTAGIISARARDINSGPYDDYIQTDAAINRGNSGGPMFNMAGEVIGINAAIYTPSGGSVGIGFAIPAAMAQPIIEKLRAGKTIDRGWLGVKIQNVTREIAESLGLPKEEGALIVEITKDSPAEKGGFLVGDVVIKFDNKEISGMRRLPRIVAETEIGRKVDVSVWRSGAEKNLKVAVGELKEEKEEKPLSQLKEKQQEMKNSEELLGMSLVPVTPELRQNYNIDKSISGLLVLKVTPGSEAAENGIKRGDIIAEANQKKLSAVKDMDTSIKDAKDKGRKSLLLLINRSGTNVFVALPVEAKPKR